MLALTSGPDLGAVRVELVSGRADLALREGVVTLVGRPQAQTLEGPAYLETGPASSVAVRWRSEASCELRGVNALEWRAPHDGRGVFVSAWRVSEVDFEVRRGPLRVELGSGWRVELAVGAASLRTLADGRIELRHVAGSPLALHRNEPDGRVSPPWTLLPGAQVRLDPRAETGVVDAPRARRALPPPPPGRDALVPAPAWAGFAWPWAPLEREFHSPAGPEPAERASPARIEGSRVAPAASERSDAEPAPQLELPERRTGASTPPLADDTQPSASAAHDVQHAGGELEQARGVAPSAQLEAAADATRAPWSAFEASLYPPVRRSGVLVLTPFGPRWADRP